MAMENDDWQVEYLDDTTDYTGSDSKSSTEIADDHKVDILSPEATQADIVNYFFQEKVSKPQPIKQTSRPEKKTTQSYRLQQRNGDFTREESEITRWTSRETKELLLAYKKYAADMVSANSYRQKRLVWDKIASEMNITSPRTCSAYLARVKMENMKKTFVKQLAGKGRGYWRYFKLMKEVMDTEKALKCNAALPSDATACIKREESDTEENRSNDADDTPPLWFIQMTAESQKRHEEVMALKRGFCSVLEALAAR